ncbi:MAG TPA: TRAP transporter large permease [Syntrophorhabdales bacterium]|nr:TRAP transporter large permease [Syntrophorhabdales bacterium]
MSIAFISLIIIVLLFALFLLGLGIGISMAVAGFIGFAWIVNLNAALSLVANDTYSIFSSYGFTVIPLFVLMGQVGVGAGMAKSLYDSAYKFIGHVSGGLAIGTVMAGTAFKAICGSTTATTATFATIAVPEMDRYGYDKRLSTGIVATIGTLGSVFPPSVVLVIYGLLTETSIGRLFLAGMVPGLMIAFSFVITLFGWCKINPKLGPRGERSSWTARFKSLLPVLWVVGIFLLVVGGLMMGFFTPTEAGSVGTAAVLVLAVVKRDITFARFVASVKDSLVIACMVFMLLAGATILGHFFAVTKMPVIAGEWLTHLPVHRTVIMIIIILIYLIGGSFIEDLAFLILVTPIFLPIVLKLGYDPVWFGIVVSVTCMIGIIIPPMAVNVFVVSGITKVPISTIYKGCYPYIVGMSICLLIIVFFPEIALWLPRLLIK